MLPDAALRELIKERLIVADSRVELARSGIGVAEFSLGQPSLDEVFLALTGHTAEEQDDATREEQAA